MKRASKSKKIFAIGIPIAGFLIIASIFLFVIPFSYTAITGYTVREPYSATECRYEQEPYSTTECTERLPQNTGEIVGSIIGVISGGSGAVEECYQVTKYRSVRSCYQVTKY